MGKKVRNEDKTEEKEVVKNKGGRPPKKIVDIIDVDNLPTQFRTAEELRGYILAQTNGGRDIIDNIIRDFKSHKTSKTVRKDLAKMLLEMITPQKGQAIELGFQSPDGQFVFKWEGEDCQKK